MKTWWIVLGSVILLFLTSSYPKGSSDDVLGQQAPDFAFVNATNKVETPALRGKVTVVTFWRAGDAQSRIDNIRYQCAVAKSDSKDIEFVSVNLDADTNLADNIAAVDGIPAAQLYNIKDAKLGDVMADYHLQDGCRTYMIASDGVVAAINPAVDEIAKI